MKLNKILFACGLIAILFSFLIFSNHNDTEHVYSAKELPELEKTYLSLFNPTGALFLQDWNSANEIEASELIQFCAYNNLCNLPTDPPDGQISHGAMYLNGYAPADKVEKAITQYFDVQSDHLKTAREYDAATNFYLQPYGFGGSGTLSLLGAREKEEILVLTIRVCSTANSHFIVGDLQIQLEDSGQFRFMSYKIKERG